MKKTAYVAPENKTVSNISFKLNGVEQAIESSKQDGNTISIHLKSTIEVKTGVTLAVSFGLINN